MWQTIFEELGIITSVMLCALAVKLVDDFLDNALDKLTGSLNFTTKLGNGTPIYALLALTLAASLNSAITIPLFLASYSIGMFNDLKQTFPSSLTGIQESLLTLLLGTLLWGWQRMLFSFLFICAIQLFDDYVDMHVDELVGYRNLACRIGKVECLLLAILTLLSSYAIDEHMFFHAFFGTFLFYSVLFFYQKGEY